MNTFWLKVVGIVIVVVGIIILVNALLPKSEPEPQKTVYDVWEKDDKRLRAEPQFTSPNQPVQPQEQQTTPQTATVEPPKPQFKELGEEEKVEAERLWEWVVTQRKMGRLPMMSYKQMVDNCREIIRRWPESEYAFKAKRALADIPEQYREMYHITKEETDLGNIK